MERLNLILLCLVLGYFSKLLRLVPQSGYITLNKIVIYLCLPAIVITKIGVLEINHDINFFSAFLWPIAMPWLFFFLAFLFSLIISKVFHLSKMQTGVVILLAGLGNTAFIGFPLIEAFYGAEGLKTGILVDQLGSFFVLSILGTSVASYYAGRNVKLQTLFKKIIFFPPFSIFCLVAILRLYSSIPQIVINSLEPLADMLAPIALLSIGMQLNFKFSRQKTQMIALGSCLIFKLIFGPALIFLLTWLFFPEFHLNEKIVIFEAAMPPMISAGIVATEYGLPEGDSSHVITMGTVVSMISMPIWYAILTYF